MTRQRAAIAWGRTGAWMRRHEYLTAGAFLTVLLCIWFSPLFSGHQLGQPGTFYGMYPWAAERLAEHDRLGRLGDSDVALQMQPLTELARDQLHRGHLPLVNPYSAGGMPLLADMQTALAFPVTWLAFVLPVDLAWGWMKLLGLLVAGLGAYALARHFRISCGSSLASAAVYMLSAPLIVWAQHPVGAVAAFLPWLLLTSDRLYERPSPRHLVAVGFVVGLSLLAGHPETAFASTSAAGVYLLTRAAVDRGRPVQDRLRAGGAWLAGHVLGVGIAAIVVIPFLDAHQYSISAQFRAQDFTSLRLPLTSVLVLALPDIYGDGRPEYYGPLLFYSALAGYFGVGAGVLALLALLRHRHSPRAIALAAVAMVAVMTMFGLPPVYWIIDNVWPWSQAGLVRSFYVVAICAAIGAGAGIDSLVRRPLSRTGVVLLLAGVAGVVAIVLGIAARRGLLPAPPSIEKTALLRFAVLLAATGICIYALGRLRRGGLPLALVMALLVVDLVQFRSWNVIRPHALSYPGKTAGLDFLQRQSKPFRVALIRPTLRDLPVLSPNLPARYRLESVEGYDFPAPRRWMDLRWFVLGHRGSGREILDYSPAPTGPALTAQRMINTRYYLAAPGTRVPAGLRAAYRGPDLTIFEDQAAMPRAYVVGRTRAVPDDQAMFALASGLARPAEEALVPQGAPVRSGGGVLRPASFEQLAPDRFRVRVPPGKAGGWLVVGQSYTPQWQATVDGRSTQLYPTDLALMGLPVDAEGHVVEIRRSRADLTVGALVTVGSLALVLVILLRARKPGRAP